MREQPMTNQEIEEIEVLVVHWSSGVRLNTIKDLCISHRLLEKELIKSEKEVNYLEETINLSEI